MIVSRCLEKYKKLLAHSRERKKLDLTLTSAESQNIIATAIENKTPYLVARMGWLEACLIGQFLTQGELSLGLRERLELHAGVYPATTEQFEKFATIYLKAVEQSDVLALMQGPYEGWLIESYARRANRVALTDLEPYFHQYPWSKKLEGKKVLVVHPFEKSIIKQYHSVREKLFKDSHVLPLFELEVIKAPQTIAGTLREEDSWEKTLKILEGKIECANFDVAILGCGAYGLPLGAIVKGMGKIAIHLGGATQLLFGVSGGRWRNHKRFKHLITQDWRDPLPEERPENYRKIEEGAYW